MWKVYNNDNDYNNNDDGQWTNRLEKKKVDDWTINGGEWG